MLNASVIKDARVLTEDFIPKEVVHRASQVEVIENNLKPLLDGNKGRNMLIYGPTGAGKTCITRYVLQELSSHVPDLKRSFVNCWTKDSNFKIIYDVITEIGSPLGLHRKGTSTDDLLAKLKELVKEQKCILALDEVDQLEDDKLLYQLSQLPNLTMIFIANRNTVFYDADPRVRSRLEGKAEVEFSQYSSEELEDILSDRAKWGLAPDAIEDRQLKKIALAAKGDARKGITALRIAAEAAERESDKIKDGHIQQALPRAGEDKKQESLASLNQDQRLLYQIIEEEEEIEPAQLYEKYEEEKEEDCVVRRTVRKYLNKMERYGLISKKGKGRWTTYQLND